MSNPNDALRKKLWTVWTVLVALPIGCALAALAVRQGVSIDIDPSTRRILGIALFVVAVGDTFGVLLLGGVIARFSAGVVAWCLFRWVVAQSPALMGLVYLVLGGAWLAGAALMAWTVLLMLVLAPSEGLHRRFEELTGDRPASID